MRTTLGKQFSVKVNLAFTNHDTHQGKRYVMDLAALFASPPKP